MEEILNKLIIELKIVDTNKIKCLSEIILFIYKINQDIFYDIINLIELNNNEEYLLTYIGTLNYINKNYSKELDCFFRLRKAKEFKLKNSLYGSS